MKDAAGADAPENPGFVRELGLFDSTMIVAGSIWPGLVIVLSGIPVYFRWRRLRPE